MDIGQELKLSYYSMAIVTGNESTSGAAVSRHADGGVPPRGHVGAQRGV